MDYNFKELAHPGIRTLKPYIPGKTIEEVAKEHGVTDIIKLASNENAWGCSPAVHDALSNLSNQTLSLYPQSVNHALRQKLAEFLGIEADMLMLSNGSDLIYGLLLTCFALQSDKHVLTHRYAFSTYEIQANTLGIPIVITPTNNWRVDIDAILDTCNVKTALIFLANPNNPTGLLINHADITRLLNGIPKTTLLVVDEAYYEYAYAEYQANTIELLAKHPNLIITRTFSKAYGLAGLRLGYAIADPQIINLLYSIQLPFTVNIAAMTAAQAALDDQLFIKKTIRLTKDGITQMQQGLDELGISYLPTSGNFITMDCNTDGNIVFQQLQKYGIIVRPLHPYAMNNYLRVTIGTEEQNNRFIKTIQQLGS
ncbi:MAG: histidinol-phosphate transaminase [Legionellaceae bacterium]|nr:histidinol-phosphate transaminase [Legionellaceae bacterium]